MQTERGGLQVGAVTEVVLLFVVGLLLLVVIGVLWSGMSGPLLSWLGLRALSTGRWAVIPQVVLPELLGLCLPACLFLKWRQGSPVCQDAPLDGSSLERLLQQLVAGLLLGGALFYFLGVWLLPLYERLVPLSPSEQRALLRMLVPPQGLRPLWIDLLTFALCPALCEELFFRGAILRHLLAARADLPAEMAAWGMQKRATAVVLSSLLFGIIHLSWGRLVPTAVLGAAFALAVLRSGSLWTVIAMHFANNAVVVMLARQGISSLPSVPMATSGALLVPACLALGLGIWLLKPRSTRIDSRCSA